MKVAILTNEYPPNVYGGAGVHVDYLTRVLRKRIKVHVSYFGNGTASAEEFAVRGYKSGLCSKRKDRDDKTGRTLDALDINLRMLNDFPQNIDLVHTHTWYTAFAGVIGRILYGIPHVLTTHSLEPLREWKREQLGLGYDLSSWLEKTAIESASGIIAVSAQTKRDILAHFNVAEHKIRVIHNGIDVKEYSPVKSVNALKKYAVDPSAPYVLFVGRITRQKGLIHLVNAVKHIDKSAQIVLCAGAPDTKEIAQEMKKAVYEAKKYNPRIVWIDRMLPKREVIEFYTHASVFCCPSIYEPFGIINLEAMACGTPVVATRTGGIVEVVEDGRSGFMVPIVKKSRNNPDPKYPMEFSKGFARRINYLLRNKDLRQEMSAYSRKLARTKFSWESIGKQTIDYYKFLLGFKRNKKESLPFAVLPPA